MRSSAVVAPIVIALVAGGARAAAVRPEPAPAERTLLGTWGGERIRVDGAATGARIQVDCLLARTEKAIPLDKTGAFSVAVAFASLGGAQIDDSERPPTSQVNGRVDNDVLHISITADGSEAKETFTLYRNAKAKLPNCRFRS